MVLHTPEMDRRTLLKTLGSVAAGAAFSKFSAAAAPPVAGKPFRGLFPIAATPFTPDNKLDLDCLNNEVKFCNRGGGPGLIDRKSTRLNSSHLGISYAVFCLKKKKV